MDLKPLSTTSFRKSILHSCSKEGPAKACLRRDLGVSIEPYLFFDGRRKKEAKTYEMKGLILIAGFDSKLPQLTLNVPKPLLDFANKPMIVHHIEALKEVGVSEVVLAINCEQEMIVNFLQEFQERLGITITCSQETEPLGTGGHLALAKEKLVDDSGDPFFVLHSDAISEFPFADMIKCHKFHQGEATILVTKVDEPSKYGVVVMEEESGRVERFVEKPEVFVGNNINAGIYLLNPSVLQRIEVRPTSIEKEVFPKIAEDGKLFAMLLGGFWMDIGEPKDYITGSALYLKSLESRAWVGLAFGPQFLENVLIHETAIVSPDSHVGPDVVIGPWCHVDAGARLASSTLMRGARVKTGAYVLRSIIGSYSTVGKWSQVSDLTLGQYASTGDEVSILTLKRPHIKLGSFVQHSGSNRKRAQKKRA